MLLTIAAVGKLKGPERELYERYAGRVDGAGKSQKLGPLSLIEIGESRKSSARARGTEEAEALLARIPDGATVIALDEKGDVLTSKEFSALLLKERDGGASCLAFVIGGPDGHGKPARDRSGRTLCLGAMTLPHGLARVVLAEQLYRAVTIASGHPYHRN